MTIVPLSNRSLALKVPYLAFFAAFHSLLTFLWSLLFGRLARKAEIYLGIRVVLSLPRINLSHNIANVLQHLLNRYETFMMSHQLAIAKASFSAGLLRPDPTSLPRESIEHFHSLLNALVLQCTPGNVQV